MSDKALDAVLDNQLKFGGDMSIAVGPIGKGIGADTTTNLAGRRLHLRQDRRPVRRRLVRRRRHPQEERLERRLLRPGRAAARIVIERKFKNPNTKALLNALSPY